MIFPQNILCMFFVPKNVFLFHYHLVFLYHRHYSLQYCCFYRKYFVFFFSKVCLPFNISCIINIIYTFYKIVRITNIFRYWLFWFFEIFVFIFIFILLNFNCIRFWSNHWKFCDYFFALIVLFFPLVMDKMFFYLHN